MSSSNPVHFAVYIILGVIGVLIGITAMLSQAPTIATLTNTATGTALANAGITGNTLAGTVYSFVNVVWALGPFILPVVFVLGLYAAHKGGLV